MDLPKEVSKSPDKSDSENDQRTSAMSGKERTHQNITTTSAVEPYLDIHGNNFTPTQTMHPPVFHNKVPHMESCRGGSSVQHLSIPLLMHLDPHNTG